ncbi:MAG: archaeosortase/exosortase family protein [Methanobacteriota archaeon]
MVFFLIFAVALAVIQYPLRILEDISPEYFTLNGVYPWAILFLCAIFLFAKRHEIHDAKHSFMFAAAGAGIISGSFFLPGVNPEFEIFRLLLAWLGLAFVFFGEAASLPALLLCIYGFGISFPKLVEAFAGLQYAQATTWVTYNIAQLFIPINVSGTIISMTTLQGDNLMVEINAACSGAASMSVFLVVFALMSLDVPLPRRKWAALLLFGIIGTSLQNILRLVLLLLAGYYSGPSAIQGGESIAGYIIFPLWYALFAFVYLRCAKRYKAVNLNT